MLTSCDINWHHANTYLPGPVGRRNCTFVRGWGLGGGWFNGEDDDEAMIWTSNDHTTRRVFHAKALKQTNQFKDQGDWLCNKKEARH